MQHDVIIVGGSYSGMAAALQLLRARRSVLVIDEGKRRNRFASASHGFLGQDGVDPAAIAQTARRQLEGYPTLVWADTAAVAIDGECGKFAVISNEAEIFRGKRILLATGVIDHLPPIAGLYERWGRSVFHCPYCHGYELDRGRIGIVATGPMSIHQAELLTEWGEVTLLTNAAISLDEATRQNLRSWGVAIEDITIERIEETADVFLSDGRRLSFAGLFVAPRCEPASPLAAESGCELEETPIGFQVRIDETNETSVRGIFACGDTARAPHSVSFAVGGGAMAGIQLHRSLIWPPA